MAAGLRLLAALALATPMTLRTGTADDRLFWRLMPAARRCAAPGAAALVPLLLQRLWSSCAAPVKLL